MTSPHPVMAAVSAPVHVGILSVVPSPYQRDLFSELASRPDVELDVFYQYAESVDNPWPEANFAAYEHLLSGRRLSYGVKRIYINWNLPNFDAYDLAILNTSYVSPTAQWVMRSLGEDTQWVFWGERMRAQPSWWRRIAQKMLAAPLGQADAIAGIGSLAVDSYRHAFPEQTLYNIPYFTDLSSFVAARQSSEPSDPVTILFCGQMIERKGVDLLLKAFERLVEDDLSVRLRLVGREADLPEMMHTVNDRTRDCIEMLGFQDPDNLPELFGTADVFVLPSRHDGWGVVVNQALGAGLPIVCSDAVGAAHGLVEPEKNGVQIPAGTVEPLYDALKRVTTDDALRRSWAEEAGKKAANWGIDEGVSRWLRVARDLVPEARQTSSTTDTDPKVK